MAAGGSESNKCALGRILEVELTGLGDELAVEGGGTDVYKQAAN